MIEQWKQVPGFPKYKVSDQGNVRGPHKRNLKPRVLPKGYVQVILSGRRDQYIHRIVLTTFDRPPEPGEEANHKNGNKADNRLENLEWVTSEENKKHAVANGLTPAGERNGMSKLTESDVLFVLILRRAGWNHREIAQHFQVSKSTISHIMYGRRWAIVTQGLL